MTHPIVRYTGSFLFRDRPMLDRARARAQEMIDTETELAALAGGWLRCFGIDNTTLHVHLALDDAEHTRSAATEVFALLSREALEGSVIASVNNVPVEHYSVQPWGAIG
jgi:hypothetical protein